MNAPVIRVAGRAYPWGAKNVDTDLIIPARWLKTISREGLGQGAFESVRARPGNIFDDARYAGAPILIAGENFGCGSSREHAAWAIRDMGIQAIIAPSFSDIFAGNAFKNGIITVTLPQAAIDRLLELADAGSFTVDLETLSVRAGNGETFPFELDGFRRTCLMQGIDEISLTLEHASSIAAFERAAMATSPWSVPGQNRTPELFLSGSSFQPETP